MADGVDGNGLNFSVAGKILLRDSDPQGEISFLQEKIQTLHRALGARLDFQWNDLVVSLYQVVHLGVAGSRLTMPVIQLGVNMGGAVADQLQSHRDLGQVSLVDELDIIQEQVL